MPESKSRNPHQHHQNHPAPLRAKPKKRGQAALVAMVLFGLLGLGFGYLTTEGGLYLLSGATIFGAVAGYIVGYQIDKVLEKK
ncbi:MAG: hypothetical protein ABIT07_06820 [Ferruginibacter sp.]